VPFQAFDELELEESDDDDRLDEVELEELDSSPPTWKSSPIAQTPMPANIPLEVDDGLELDVDEELLELDSLDTL